MQRREIVNVIVRNDPQIFKMNYIETFQNLLIQLIYY